MSNKILQPSQLTETSNLTNIQSQNFALIPLHTNGIIEISQDSIIKKYNLNKDQTIMFKIFTENIFAPIQQKICYLGGNAGTGTIYRPIL